METPKKYLVIKDYETNNIVEKIDITGKSNRAIEKIESGMNINLNHVAFYTEVTSEGWYCNECGDLNFTGSLTEKDVEKLSCIECGCTKFTYKSNE